MDDEVGRLDCWQGGLLEFEVHTGEVFFSLLLRVADKVMLFIEGYGEQDEVDGTQPLRLDQQDPLNYFVTLLIVSLSEG